MEQLAIALANYILKTDKRAQHLSLNEIMNCKPSNIEQLLSSPYLASESSVTTAQSRVSPSVSVQSVLSMAVPYDILPQLLIEPYLMQGFCVDFLLFMCNVRVSDLKTYYFNQRSYVSQTRISNEHLKYFIQGARIYCKIPVYLLIYASQIYSSISSRNDEVLNIAQLLRSFERAMSSNSHLILRYRFLKITSKLIRDILNEVLLTQEILVLINKVIYSLQVQYSQNEILSDEAVYLYITKLIDDVKTDIIELIIYIEENGFHEKPLPETFFAQMLFITANLALYDQYCSKMTATTETLSQLDKVLSIFSEIYQIPNNDLKCVFVLQYGQYFQSIAQIREPEVLYYFIEKSQLSEQMLNGLRYLSEPVVYNYIIGYSVSQESFVAGIKLVYLLQQGNPDAVIEKLIQNTLKQRYAVFKQEFAEIGTRSIQINIYKFDEFFTDMAYEVDCQLKIFIPMLCQLYQCNRFVNKEIYLTHSYLSSPIPCYKSPTYNINLKNLIMGGVSDSLSHAPRTHECELRATPLTVFVALSFNLLQDIVSFFYINWAYIYGQFYRIPMQAFKSCLFKIERICYSMYDAVKKYLIDEKSSYSKDDRLDRLHLFFPRDSVIQTITPLIKQAFFTEFEYLGSRVEKALQVDEPSSYDPFALDDDLKNRFKLPCSTITEDLLVFMDFIFQELVNPLVLSESSTQKLYQSMKDIVEAICNEVAIRNPDAHSLPELESVFSGESTFKKGGRVFEQSYHDGFSSASLCVALYDERTRYPTVQRLNQFFDDTNTRQQRPNVYLNPHILTDIYPVLDFVKLRINALDALSHSLQQFQCDMFGRSFQFSTKGEGLIGIVRPQQHGQNHFTIVYTLESKIGADYFGLIFQYLQVAQEDLTRFMGNYLVFSGMRPLLYYVYCPTPQFCGIENLVRALHYTAKQALKQLAPTQRVATAEIISENMAQSYRFLLLDSGKRARTICYNDSKQLEADLATLMDLAVFRDCSTDGLLDMEQLVSNEHVNEYFRQVSRLVKFFSMPSNRLQMLVENIDEKLMTDMDTKYEMKQVKGEEEFVRVLNFRRYADEGVRKYMRLVKRRLRK